MQKARHASSDDKHQKETTYDVCELLYQFRFLKVKFWLELFVRLKVKSIPSMDIWKSIVEKYNKNIIKHDVHVNFTNVNLNQ